MFIFSKRRYCYLETTAAAGQYTGSTAPPRPARFHRRGIVESSGEAESFIRMMAKRGLRVRLTRRDHGATWEG